MRNYTQVQEAEWNDSSITDFIEMATSHIEQRTNRAWSPITVTDELYDGDGSDTLKLNHIGNVTISSLGIDDDDDGTFTSITTSEVNVYSDEGIYVLTTDAEVDRFTLGNQTVKTTYTYGESAPTEDIKLLTILLVTNFMHEEPQRTRRIEREITRLKDIGGAII